MMSMQAAKNRLPYTIKIVLIKSLRFGTTLNESLFVYSIIIIQ